MKLPAFTLLEWVLGAVVTVGVIAALGFAVWSFDPFGRRHRAEQAAATATVQAKTNDAAATIAGKAAVETRIIHETTERVVHDVQQAPSASAPLPDDLRASLCAGLSELRDGAQACTDFGTGQPR